MNYNDIPEIAKAIETIKRMEISEDKRIRESSKILQFNEGQELTLQIKVTDKYLFQLIASSLYQKSDDIYRIQIPGAEILEIGWNKKENIIREWLNEQIKKLEEC